MGDARRDIRGGRRHRRDRSSINLRFGLTPFRKRIPLSDISSCQQVRNRWYYGWGIRYIGIGWLYNVSG